MTYFIVSMYSTPSCGAAADMSRNPNFILSQDGYFMNPAWLKMVRLLRCYYTGRISETNFVDINYRVTSVDALL